LLLIINFSSATGYAGDFEEFGASARALALGGAYVAVVSDASAIYYNPAASSLVKSPQLFFLHSENYTGGIVQNNFISYVLPSDQQTYGVAVLSNRVPDIKITKLPYPNLPPSDTNRPYIDKIVNASDWVGYLNYAQALNANFNIGANIKFIYRSLGIGSGFGVGLDIGSIYKIAPDFNLGIKFTNLTTSPLFWSTKTRETILPKIVAGLSKSVKFENSSIMLAGDLESNFDDFHLNTNLGIEYQYKNTLSFRAGLYHYNPCFGIGLAYKKIFIDYAYVSRFYEEDLGGSQKFSGGIRF
jgi:hypothetical protein